MPAKKMDFKSFPSSWLYSSEESQAELWKSDKLSKGHDSNQRIEPMEAVSNFSDCNEVNTIAAPDESSLFSYSLPDLLMRKLRLSAKSVDAIASHDEDETLSDSLEKIKDRIIVDLLPDDEDELFSGVNDDHTVRDSTGGEIDELDLFSSGGGLDLERDGNSSSREKNSKIIGGARSSQLGEKLYGEHLSRTLFVRDIDSDIKDSELKSLFEQFGDIHTFDRACKHQGLAMISYYDIRDAQNAMRALQSCRKFDICYSTPKDSTSQKGVNEGTLAVLCLYDSSISTAELHSIFNVYGEIKDIHENPQSQRCKLIEFYDFRAAEKALRDLNIHDTIMKKLKVEPSQYTDSSSMIQQIHSEFKQKECSLCLLQKSPPLKPITSFQGLHGISSSVPNTLPSQIKVKSVGNQSDITESSSRGQLNFEPQSALAFPPQSLPECRHGVHRNPLEKAANINLKTHERIDNNMQFFQENFNGHFIDFDEYFSKSSGIYYQPPGTMLRNSPSYLDGNFPAPTLQRMTQLPMPPSHMISTVLPTNSHHVQSTPLWDRGYSYAPHYVNFVPHNMFHHVGPNFHNQSGMVIPGRNHLVNSYDTNKRVRSRRNVGASNLDDMARYELDIDRIKRGEDDRTTLMIKNIPNKYTSKMLLAAIDESHKGTYDFLYLPIDFKNKCNVGYAFINMTSPSLIVPLYEVFNGKNWKNFNSKKVASLAYARIQGKADLIAHFQNSSLMNEDMRCRPILINTDGPNAGDQVPFPIGNKQGRVSSNTHEDKDSISKESD